MSRDRQVRLLPRIAAALMCLASGQALALGPAHVLADIDAIKQHALQIGYRAATLRQSASDRAGPGTSVYLSCGNSGATILAAGLTVDGAAPVFSGPLTGDEAQALQPGLVTLHLARLALKPGTHHLHAEVLIKYAGDAEGRSLSLDQDYEFEGARGDLVLVPEGKSWLTSPRLALHRQMAGPAGGSGLVDVKRIWSALAGPEVRDGTYRPGSDGDPLLGYARLLIATRDFFRAAVLLNQLSERIPGAELPPEYYEALADALLGCDALAPALQVYGKAQAAGLGTARAADLRVRIAESYYQRHDYAGAEQSMGQEPPRRINKQYTQWQDLRSRLLLSQLRFHEASAALTAADAGSDFESYVRYYNLGIALIQNGLGPQGATALDRVGNVPSIDSRMIALSDGANLALASYLLQNGQGATAIPVLERIEMYGRYSDRAILDLGWAWLAPAGSRQVRVMLGDERIHGPPPESVGALHRTFDSKNVYQRYHLSPFVRAKLEGNHDARVRHALVMWSELFDRDSSSDAVQEAYLAAGMALQNLGAHRESAELYTRGIEALESARQSADETAKYVRSDRWVQEMLEADAASTRFDSELRRLPRSGISRQLGDYLAGWDFQSGMRQYRTLEVLSLNLKANLAGIDGAVESQAVRQDVQSLDDQIQQVKSEEVGLLRQQLFDHLASREQRLDRLLEGARFELARVYDGAAR